MRYITNMRQSLGWSKSELARRALMTPADVGKIESGRLLPYKSQLLKLARALDVSNDDAEDLLREISI